MRALASASLLFVALGSVGCLGRTGIGDDELASFGALDDASTTPGADTGITFVDGGGDDTATEDSSTGTDTGPKVDTGIDIFEVFPIPDGGPIGECAGCVRDNCGASVNACINSPECRAGLACTLTKCLLGGMGGGGGTGGFDFACITGCFKGDFKSAGTAISAFTCVIGKCGSKCGGFLGGLPGGLPGGGGGSGGSGGSGGGMGGKAFDLDRAYGPEELRSIDPSTRMGFKLEAFSHWSHEIESTCAQDVASCTP